MSQTTSAQATGSRRDGWGFLVYVLFFLSGLTSLVYEVIWARKFGLVFGVTTYAVSTVLAAFFTGLAVGSYAAGRLIDRTRFHPLVVYGLMEGVIGVYALMLPLFLNLVEASYPAVYARVGESFSLFTLFRFIISFAVLVVPTTLMGATLPVLSKLMVDREEVLGLNVGRLYAVNTFGAVAGTFSAGFIFIPTVGINMTTLCAALGNFALAVAAVLLSLSPSFPWHQTETATQQAAAKPLGSREKTVLALAFTSGLAIIALEVIWTRSLVLILGSTTYAFSTMLTAVLVGIALGSAVFAPLADRTGNRAAWVAGLLFFGGFAAVLGPAVINRLPFIFLQLIDWAYGEWALIIAVQFIVCFLLVFIPTFFSGGSFPLLVRMYALGMDRVGRTVADVYAINTFGGILGSLLSGFVLIKFFGLQPSLTAAALFLMLAGGVLALSIAAPAATARRAALAGVMMAVVAVLVVYHPRFDTKLLFAGWGPYAGGHYVSRLAGSTVDTTTRSMRRLLYHKEGVTASVDALESGWGDKLLSVNAKPVATTYLYDMRTLRMLGHLPALLHPNPRDALIIGLGAGVNSGIIASYPTIDAVTTVELCQEVPGGTARFAEWNHNVLEHPKFNLVFNDGANYVKATRKQYDIISADPIHPFVAGAGTLYSYEHWQIAKERLRDGGILAQWLPLYHLSSSDFATIVGTFLDAFPNATLWFCGIDTLLVGTKGDFQIDLDRMAEHMSDPVVMRDLVEMGVHEPADVLGWYIAGPEQLRTMSLGALRNTTDFPIIEFSAPKSVMLSGIASTTTALLTAVEEMPATELRSQLNEMCVEQLSAQALLTATGARLANRWLMRSQLLLSYDYTEQSLDATWQAYGLRPNDTFLQRAVGDAQLAVGDQFRYDGFSRDAYESYRDSYLNEPSTVMALTSAVEMALDLGDIPLAEETLELAAPNQREIFEYLIKKGLVAVQRESYQTARRAFEQAGAHGQESPTLHANLGFLDLLDQRPEAAQAHFARAFEIATSKREALYEIVDLCYSHGQAAAVRAQAEELVVRASRDIAANPALPSLYGARATAYAALGEHDLAERDRATKRSLSGWWEEPPTSTYVDQLDQLISP
ncbi:MAG: fused MFS/spermidine synthase [Armatimonadetes bacterium]|nr:fused MFS/spermidine synthase [Armatimonadota bacterium]